MINSKLNTRLDRFTPLIMLAPAVIGIIFLQIYPSLSTIRMSFFDINLLKPGRPFIGLSNYITAFSDPVIIRVLLNTFVWAFLSLFIGCSFALFIAIRLNKPFKGRAFFRALYVAPWVTPPIVIAIVWRQLFSSDFSPISGLLMSLGIISQPINFLGNTNIYLGFFSMPMLSLIIINVWLLFPFSMIMFLAALQTIPVELYEAAKVDGATKWQEFRKITFPMLLPAAGISILLQGIWQFNSFNLSYLVTHGGPLNTTELLSVRVYNEAFTNFKYSYGASISVVMLLIVLIPAVMYIKRTILSKSQDTI